MKRKIQILAFVVLGFVIFAAAGIPTLRMLKSNLKTENSSSFNLSIQETNSTRIIDLSVEEMCRDPVSGEPELECQSTGGCNQVCMTKGCKLFGLEFTSSSFISGKCKCTCDDPGLLKKSLDALEN